MIKPALPVLDRSNPISAGIVGAWPFSEYNVTNIHDVSGRGHTGDVHTGSPVMGASTFGQALSTNATNEGISFGNDNDFSFTDGSNDVAGSVFIKFKPDNTSTYQHITGKDSLIREWTISFNSSGKLQMFLFDTNDVNRLGRTTDNGAITGGEWYSCLMTYDASGSSSGIKLYLNGVRVDTTDNITGAYTSTSNKAIDMTAFVRDNNDFGVPGLMANLVMWKNRELTATDAKILHQNPFIMYQEPDLMEWLGGTITSASGFGGLLSTQRNRLVI